MKRFARFPIGLNVGGFFYIKKTFLIRVYGNYNTCNILSNVKFSLTYKLKILNFMKRFGRYPIGLNIGGFFYIKKTFLIRIINAIYSLLSSIIEIGKTKNDKCKRIIFSKNETFPKLY
ncbi:uncharacterized protein [Centruroides vittatus]|uniref:uncharacterized protein n=1 Tax=Centruroides vittatus TaxID=120091 RepID=UPI00350FB819